MQSGRLILTNGSLPRMVLSPVLTIPLPILARSLKNLGVRVGQEENAGPGIHLNSFPKATPLPRYNWSVSSKWVPIRPGAQVSTSLEALCGEHCTHVSGVPNADLAPSFPAPDINPAWYTGRGIRPVGRFGRRRATPRDVTGFGQLNCLPLNGRTKFSQRG